MFSQDKRILFIVAHPDDEILGCGGTLFKKSKEFIIDILVLADGASSRDKGGLDRNSITKDIHSNLIKPGKLCFLNLPDNKLDSLPLLDIIKIIYKAFAADLPERYHEVYTHSSKDLNIDHQVASKLTRIIFRPQPNILTCKLIEFETPSATEWSFNLFQPNLFVDIVESMEFKRNSLKLYETEMRNFPHPRSLEAIENLAKYRGSIVGLPYAEAFEIVWQKD